MSPNDADRMANNVDPDQTAPGLYIVFRLFVIPYFISTQYFETELIEFDQILHRHRY